LLQEATFRQPNPSHALDDVYPMTPISHPHPRNAFLAAALALAAAPLCAQIPQRQISTLPATSPTALPAANTLPAPIAATPDTTHPSHEPQRAEVTYAAGLINVRADNSSLNQILHTISRLTDMTITGGVADERVFGNYGPAEPSTILATLLDGTGSNMLLRISTTDAPSELILTPRNGGPTPPNPNAGRFDDDEDANQRRPRRLSDRLQRQGQPFQPQAIPQQAQAPAQQQQPSGPPSIPQPANDVNGNASNTSPTAASYPTTNSVPLDSVPTPSTTPSTSGIVDAPNPPPPGSTTSTSPNGVATPDQIYQQLLQMQKQKAAASSPTTTTTPQ
jgi:hypothetical protein